MAALSRLIELSAALCLLQPLPQTPLLVEEQVVEGLCDAVRLAVTPQGSLLVVEREGNSIALLTAGRAVPLRVGGYGWGQTTLDGPSGVATDGLSVLVSDRENHRIQRFDRNLNYVATLATRDTAVAQVRFGFPEGLAVSRQGDLYVLDGEGLRVVKFDVGGLFERSFGQSERSAVKLTAPLDIVVTPGERVFVLEPNRVVEYDAFGNVMRTIGEGVIRRGVGMDATDDALAVVTNDTLHWFDASGRLLWSLARNDVMSSRRLDALRDVALAGNRVFLLASWGVVVLRRG